METGRGRGRVGDEGRRHARQEVKSQGQPGKAREGPEESGGSEQVRAPGQALGHEAPSHPQEVPAAPHFVQNLEVARPPEPSRTQGLGVLPVPLFGENEGGVHQSLSLPKGTESRWVVLFRGICVWGSMWSTVEQGIVCGCRKIVANCSIIAEYFV